MRRSALFSMSRWTRDFTNRKCGEVCSGNFLGLQIELNFVPVYRAVAFGPVRLGPKAERSEDGIEFFLWAKTGVNRWFFDIYIQGSKYNFKS